MTYHLVEAKSAAQLQDKVQSLIEKGWQPQGGVCVATYAAGAWWYYQAMVKA